ncbi:MAG: glycosyltransferase family 2 protein [Desulfobacterales bacterium]|nr:glycosyltransferase family 2 protein [Desulfobacterales bacterium]
MPLPKVTILIPNYKTLMLTKLCLRLIKKHTNPETIHVIVIDNDSCDESTDYLKSLDWIEFIERKKVEGEIPALSHSRALDHALERVTTPYVLSIHTDTFVKNSNWLDALIAEIEKDSNIAGVGSWKLEEGPSFYKRFWKIFEFRIRASIYRIFGDKKKLSKVNSQKQSGYYDLFQKSSLNLNDNDSGYYYLRSHCALYRMDLIRKYKLTFSGKEKTAGSHMHSILVENNHKMIFLSISFLSKYLVHLNHATMVLHPEFGLKNRIVRKGLKRIKSELKHLKSDDILKEDTLDH